VTPSRRVKPLLGAPLACLFLYPLRLSRRRIGVAVMYHGVADRTGDPARELVPPHGIALFEAQLRHLRAHFRLVPASQLLTAARERRRGEPFPAAVTFDDDLRSHARIAMPALSRLRAPATFFLCGASLDGPHRFWWEVVQAAFDRRERRTVRRVVEERCGRLPGDDTVPLVRRLAAAIEGLPPADREAVIGQVEPLAGPPPRETGMPEADVRVLAEKGFEIGFHTLRHDRLTSLDEDGLSRALRDGLERLEGTRASRPALISYPHGKADARVAAAAREAGFCCGFTSKPEAVTSDSDPLLLGRVEPSFRSKGHLALQLAGCLLRGAGGGRG
jgi:peptidoglycan/xylan/chitin deacetylase (PgdA/CDA1 family)